MLYTDFDDDLDYCDGLGDDCLEPRDSDDDYDDSDEIGCEALTAAERNPSMLRR